jgi:hypothetical protein
VSKLITPVPFYANTADNKHCFEASIRMVLKYFLPEQDFSWDKLDEMSAKVPGKATWPQQTLINLHNMGFDIALIEGFDGHAFVEKGAVYLQQAFGKEVADWQVANSDIEQEQRIYSQLFQTDAHVENRIPTLAECKKYLENGYLTICMINSRKLNNKEGYAGHAVLVYQIDDTSVMLHDPGLPPQQARTVSHNEFEAAWAYPNTEAKSIIAIKYKKAD